jgi:peptidoglycan/xylan/chitin deacetylase (PgdA/CDA1 family)
MKATMKAIAGGVINVTGLGKPAHWAVRHRPLILMYHGLTEDETVFDWTQVRASDFERQMVYMKDHFQMVSLADIVAMLESGGISPHAATVTFDDGYESNFTLAWPVLKRLQIPATIFVTSGFVNGYDRRQGFLWPDYITALLRSHSSAELDFTGIGLGPLDISTPQSLARTRNIISEYLKTFPADEKDASLACIERRHGGVVRPEAFPDYQPLQLGQLGQLAEAPLITIGAHSINHQILSQLAPDKLEAEIGGSKTELEKRTGRPVRFFAYPNGRLTDINKGVVETTARHFSAAVTTETGFNRANQNKYLLRRVGIGRNLLFGQFRVLVSGLYYIVQEPLTLE